MLGYYWLTMDDDSEPEPGELFDGVEAAQESSTDEDGNSEPLVTPEDRPRGILSPTDREYLCGHKEYAQPQTDANRRQDIRERVKNGLKDFTLLWLFLERDEREKVFAELGEDTTDEVIGSMVAFAYLALDEDSTRFEECIERGVLGATNADKLFQSAGRATDADVSIDIDYNPDAERLYRQYVEGRQLTDAEIGILVRSGKLDADDIQGLHDSKSDFPGVFIGGEKN